VKKEIEVIVQEYALEAYEKGNFNDLPVFRTEPAYKSGAYLKCKLVVPVKEKKIEITEAEFWKALDECKRDVGEGVIVTPIQFKEKLFGER
jgi:hypothetical protein